MNTVLMAQREKKHHLWVLAKNIGKSYFLEYFISLVGNTQVIFSFKKFHVFENNSQLVYFSWL